MADKKSTSAPDGTDAENVPTGMLVDRPLVVQKRLSKTLSVVLWMSFALVCVVSTYFKHVDGSSSPRAPTPSTRLGPEKIESSTAGDVAAPAIAPYEPIEAALRILTMGRAGNGTKRAFMGPQLIERPRGAAVPPGTLAEARLVSGASNGPVKAMLSEAVYVNGEPVLEEGVVLLGSGASTEERLFVRFGKLVFRDGHVEQVQIEAADHSDKIAGLKGSKVGSRALRLAGSIGLNFVTGMTEVLQDQNTGPMGMPVKEPTLKNAFLNGTEHAATEEAEDILSGLKEAKPIIEVGAGTLIYVLFGEGG